jgi:phosphate starvation-inducible protein PhoH and related proteins
MSPSWQELRDLSLIIRPKTLNQETYWKAIFESDVTLCSGPAGSGKTLLACAIGVELLKQGKVERLVLVRPMVSCGATMGYFPGDPDEKLMPYMLPLLECLQMVLLPAEIRTFQEKGAIVFSALELMRGRSLKNSFVLLDESQNAGYSQIHMFLTRLSTNSKMVLTGDISKSQTDTHQQGMNPFSEVIQRFRRERPKEIAVVYLNHSDILRHPLIGFMDKRLTEPFTPCQYWHIQCPACSENLWYTNDDPDCHTTDTIEVLKCWACGRLVDVTGDQPVVIKNRKTVVGLETFPVRP